MEWHNLTDFFSFIIDPILGHIFLSSPQPVIRLASQQKDRGDIAYHGQRTNQHEHSIGAGNHFGTIDRWKVVIYALSGKKLKSVFDFLTYSRETGFSFSYAKVEDLLGLIGPSNKIDGVSKFDNSLLFGAKQNALRQMFFAL